MSVVTVYEDFTFIKIERHPDGVLVAILNRPEVRNAMNEGLHEEIAHLFPLVHRDPSIKVLIVTGAGEAFSVGGDPAMVQEMVNAPGKAIEIMQEMGDTTYSMLDCNKIIISAINGDVVGAGLPVALMADISIIAEDALLTEGHAHIGVPAGNHAAMIWPLLCGMAKTKYYVMTGTPMSGKEAERIGLVTMCVPREMVLERALEVAAELSVRSQTALRANKRILNNWMRVAGPILDQSLALEMLGFLGDDAKEGVAARREGRRPAFPSARIPTS